MLAYHWCRLRTDMLYGTLRGLLSHHLNAIRLDLEIRDFRSLSPNRGGCLYNALLSGIEYAFLNEAAL